MGRKLLTFATEHARSVKLSCVLGFIKARNATPIRIVESLGWRAVGASPPIELGDAEWCWHFFAGPLTYTCAGVGRPLSAMLLARVQLCNCWAEWMIDKIADEDGPC